MTIKDVIEPKNAFPIFAGETVKDEIIILYLKGKELYLRRPDGEIHALEPGAFVQLNSTIDYRSTLAVRSKVWSGTAFGDRQMTIEAEALAL